MKLQEGLVLIQKGAGLYQDKDGEAWRLMPVDREYEGKKKPTWYLQKVIGKKAVYQSGVFKTKKPTVLSADYKDELGVKHYLDIEVEVGGRALKFKDRAPKDERQVS